MKLTRTLVLATGLSMTLGCMMPRAFAAAEPVHLRLTLREHHFVPRALRAPAGVPLWIEVTNTDITDEEFVSRRLDVKKLVPSGGTVIIKLLPLTLGQYPFFGAYSDSARGELVVTTVGAR